MRPLRLLLSVALVATAVSPSSIGVFAQVAQTTPQTDSNNNSTASTAGAPATVTSCEQIGLVSISVRGAPNAFCVPTNTCNSNYVGSCPGAGAVDSKGVLLPSGSCCSALESTGVVGCVSLSLVQSGAFQCITHAGASDTAPVVDITTATPLPTTATPAPTTSAPTTTSPPSTTAASNGSNAGPSETTGQSSAPETEAPSPETSAPTPPPATITKAPPASTTVAPDVRPSKVNLASSSSSSSSSSGSSSGFTEPEAGVDPTVSVPVTVPRPVTPSTPPPPAPTGPLEALAPIPDGPSPPTLGNVAVSGTEATSAKNPTTRPLSENGSSSSTSSSASGFVGTLNDNIVLAVVLGTVASVAIVVGAFLLRRRRGSESSSASTTGATSSAASRTGKAPVPELDIPKMTIDGDDDMLEDLQFRQTDAFSPIFVQPTHSYTETRTPGNDRQSYFL